MEHGIFGKALLHDNRMVRINIAVEKNSVRLVLLQNNVAWKSHVDKENLLGLSVQHELSIDNYCEKLLNYIQNASSEVIFIVTPENEFIINRVLGSGLKVKYFTCNLEKADYVEVVETLLDQFYLENAKNVETLNNVLLEKVEVENEKSSCEMKLKELVQKKRQDEDEQLGDFIMVLNEKKRQIQHLSELLNAFKKGRPTTNPPVAIRSSKSKKKGRKKQIVSDSEHSDNSSTENETRKNNNVQSKTKNETISESEPSDTSSAENESNNSDDKHQALPIQLDTISLIETFDFLEDDLSDSSILPKRIKRSNDSTSEVKVIPSTSKSDIKLEIPLETSKRSSPTIDISTQQLFDML